MASPALVAETSGGVTASGTSHAITLPATVGVGDRLVAVLAMQPSATGSATFTWPAGWTELIDSYQDTALAVSVGWRIADGTEDGGTVTVTSSKTEKASHKSWGFSGAGNVYAGIATFAYGTAPNPPSLNPGIGSADFHWIAVECSAENKTVSVYPTGYTSTGSYYPNVSAPDDATIAWGRKTSTAASDNPSAFTITSSAYNVGITIAVAQSLAVPTISTVGTITPGATVAVTYSGYGSVPLTANSTLNGVGITVSAADLNGCNITAPAESAFLFGGAHAATRFNTDITLVLANGSETDSHTVQVVPASSDQLAARSADALVNPIDSYNGGLTVATSDDVYQYSDPADYFTPFPATNDFTPLEPAFTLYTKFYDVSASSWSSLTSLAFPTADAPGGGTLAITATLLQEEPPAALTVADVNLTSFGGLDWYKTARSTTQTFDTKSGGSMIGAPADIGTPAWARDVGGANGHPLVTWTNGAELGTHTGDRGYDYTTVNGAGQRFTISPAGALVKIYLWAGGYNASTYKVAVSFSDSSATAVELEYTSASVTHKFYRYEITAQPSGGAATIQIDVTKVSGSGLMGWQAIAVESGTSAATYSLTVSDTTLTPGQSATATLVGGPFQGAITAAYAVYGENEIPIGWSVLTPTTTSITAPGLSAFSAGQHGEFLPWYANWTLRIVAGNESADSPNTNQIVPPIVGDYGTVAAPPWGNYAVSGAQEADSAYIHVVTGAGTATPESFNFSESEDTIVHIYCFNVAAAAWLARRVAQLPNNWVNTDQIVTGMVKRLVKSTVKVIS